MKKEKNRYITPLLTVVEFKAERGYSASDPIQKWTGFSINQEILMVTEGDERINSDNGEFVASTFGEGSAITGGSAWSNSDGTWF